MQKMYSKFLSILLTVCMIGSILPTAVFAEDGSQNSGTPLSTSKTKQLATNLRVKGLPTIAAGQPLPTSIEGITVSNCTVTGLSWTESVSGNFLGMSKDISEDYYNYTFIPGRTYMIKIAITANEGYKLNSYSASGEVSTVQSVDGELVDSDKSKVAYDSQETKKHTVWYLYTTLPEDEENKISKLTFTCKEPTIGQALCAKNAIAVTGCDISNIIWRKNNIYISTPMCDGAGKYELRIVCAPKEGKYFAKDLTATINNNKITVINNSLYNGYYNTDFYYTFTVTEANVDAIVPIITAHPADANYTVGDTATVLTTGANIGDGGTLSYQWYSNAINSNNGGAEISGERTEIYTPPTDTARTTYYYCVVTNTNNSATGNTTATATSYTAKIIVTNNDSYAITVNSGTANPSIAAENATVTITANTAPSGQRFKEWTVVSGGVTLASTTSATTTFTMPANAVEVTATYESNSVNGINITDKFTDVNFLAEVRKALKKDANYPILDIDDFSAVTSLNIRNKNIKSLAGIEYFTALTTLDCSSNQLTTLDVSKNTELTRLFCYNNQLAALDVSNNTELTHLFCNNNQLTALDVSNNTALIELYCYNNQLAALDVSNNTAFTKLDCKNNQLSALDVSKNAGLIGLWCNSNQLTTLDVSNNTALSLLDCSKNYMPNKSAVKGLNTNQTKTFIFDPQKTSTSTYPITVNSGTASTSTAVAGATVTITANAPGSGQQFKEWTVVSGGVTLANAQAVSTSFTMPANAVVVTATYKDISASGTDITADFTDANFLAEVRRALKKYGSIPICDTDDFASVKNLSVSSKSITSLAGIEYFTALTTLNCSGNQLTELDVSKNTKLIQLSCNANQLTALDVSNNTALTMLNCSYNYMANESAVNGLDTNLTKTFIFDPQKTSTSAYSITVNSGTASQSPAAKGATVSITASTPQNGKRFKVWTVVSGGVTLANAQTASTTFTMPANAVVVTATYEDISASVTPVTGVTLNKNNLYLYSNTTPNTATLTATVSPSNATDKSVTWQSSNTAVATVDTSGNVKAAGNGTANITVTTTDGGHITSCTVTVSTYTSGGGSSSGGGGSSSGGSTSTPTVTTPPTTTENSKPATEVTATVKPTVSNGTVTAAISNETVNSAIAKAQAENKKNETEGNGIVVEINVDTKNTTAKNLTANLPKLSVDTLVNTGTNELRITSEVANINLNLDTLKEIQKQVGVDVNVTAKKVDNNTLSAEAKKIVGNRPVYDFSITGTNGKKVTNFGNGSVSVSVPYTLGKNEIAANVVAYYIDSQGKVIEMPNSVYDPVTKTLRFVTDHFSKFAVGYKTTSIAFTDITSHWAKKSIEFVSARGLLAGTGNDKFSPNVSMTRGIFVTALGRLAEVNVASYTTSVFTDVKADAYYMPYVEWASKNDIVNGTSMTTFAPDESITREQMAVIMANYAKVIGFELPKVYAENTFADGANISTQAKDAVKQMQMAGILAGKNDNKFDPQGTATRAEVSALLKRFVELAVSADTAEGWAINDSGKWMYYENGKAVTGKKAIDGTNYTFDQYGVTADVPKNRKYNTYIVQKGDSFWLIAYKQGCTMKKLEQLNNKSRFSLIHPGDELIVPEK